jgi:hypothetical protein
MTDKDVRRYVIQVPPGTAYPKLISR